MAHAKNLLQIEGKLSGLVIYQLNNKYVVRTIGKVARQRYKTAKSFQRMRENMAEFGGSSHIGKALRQLFTPYTKSMADPYISGRLNAVIKKIISHGSGSRGQRTFNIRKYQEILMGFEFNKHHPFNSYFSAALTLTTNVQRNEVRLSLPEFNPGQVVNAPAGATHFQLVLVAATFSNYSFNPAHSRYEPTHKTQHALKAQKLSAELPLTAKTISSIQLTTPLTSLSVLDADIGLLAGVGITFLQQLNGANYPLAQGNTMQLVKVF